MDNPSNALHARTPSLQAMDPRGLAVRSVLSYRASVDQDATPRTERYEFDVAGRRTRHWDARLSADAEAAANLSDVHSLSGQALARVSVDSGWFVSLPGEAGQMVEAWDGRGIRRRVEYDSMLRPMAVFEGDGADEVCAERLTYGTTSDSFANQCGQLIRHDDPAGSLGNLSFNLTGEVIKQTRRFLIDLDLPDWPLLIEERDDLLELAEAESTWRFGPLRDVLEQTDAKGNTQSFAQTVAGQLKASNLLLRDQAARTLLSDIQYDAQGRISSEIAGNGVVTALDYDPVDGRLIRLRAGDGHLQDLNYAYDPVGNVVSIEDRAQAIRHFANQRIEPLRTFAYDTLYQLIEATGYEAAAINRGPGEDRFQVFPAANELRNYTQRYEYDSGGNLQTLVHVGAQNHTRSFATSRLSNRSLLQTGDQPPSEEQITAGFDAAGNLRELQPGQALTWDLRNQLSQVTPVKRESAANDSEVYRYDAAGMRVRKVRTTQAKAVTHLEEVRYLPGLEIRSNTATGEELHVVTVTAGHSNVRVLHWQSAPPANVANDQIRYSLTDHLGSSTLELDADAQLISQEIYYPYGETAWFAGRSEVEAKYKTVRYSGKERDATGLYYYGLRYYAPWLMRWINPDPVGEAGGINLFSFCNNSPVQYLDGEGAAPYDVLSEQEMWTLESIGLMPRARGMCEVPLEQKERLVAGIETAVALLAQTGRELSKESPGKGVLKAFESVFGKLDQEHQEQVFGELKDTLQLQQLFLSSLLGESSWKVGTFTGAPGDWGITRKVSDYEKKRTVYLAEVGIESFHTLELARVLIHESSHAVIDSVDLFYNISDELMNDADPVAIEVWSKANRRASRTILLRGPDEIIKKNPTHPLRMGIRRKRVGALQRFT
ncbi:MAG: RHS repeat protein [Pseudomonas sp.]|uniref:RHS repeat-associated core domain-containing protein n=1 Tax=Pseudomonas sp. TaxID=306 RepID=UPI0023A1B1BD|nr:RHS repeat-associated core domain-containing protein [Pseudomonas sp.]MDE1196234.1 RHS repeat protein [Pseudomonas sp.]